MGILVFLFLKLSFFWTILTIFEVTIISRMKVSTFKYIKLLKFLEFFYVILTIISTDFYLHIGTKLFSYLIYLLSIMIYFGILIYDFWKKKITKKKFYNIFLIFLYWHSINCSIIVFDDDFNEWFSKCLNIMRW